jgi:hypothetical protein
VTWVAWSVVLACGPRGGTPAVDPAAAATGDEGAALPSPDAFSSGRDEAVASGGTSRVVVTAPVAAPCGDARFQPVAPADLDDDGTLDRVAVRWDGAGFVVTIHAVPSFEVRRTTTYRADSLEFGVTRRGDGPAGDLWMSVGVAEDADAGRWRFELRRFAGGEEAVLGRIAGSSRPNLRLDLDGDGRVDPVVAAEAGATALIGGAEVALPSGTTASEVFGLPGPWGRESPVDLDGDGDRDVVATGGEALVVLEVPAMREVRRIPSRGTLGGVLAWSSAPGGAAIHALMDVLTTSESRILAADGSDAVWMESGWGEGPMLRPQPWADPAGDGSVVVLDAALASALLSAPGGEPERVDLTFALPGDPAVPRSGPVRLKGGAGLEVVGVRVLALGSPAVGGTGETRYEIRAVPPPGRGDGRVVAAGEIGGEGWIAAYLIDLEGDGESEILVEESSNYMNCDVASGGGSSSRWRLLDGEGRVIWEDERRHRSFGEGYDRDRTAEARFVDLGGGVRGVRLRTREAEWWVFPASRPVAAVPACLE